ncbi:MAG: hypothetical protein IPH93_06765 [Saprospiraceae bacterium]|nr:hypothetical protein [Saprospiraceae bacterium]
MSYSKESASGGAGLYSPVSGPIFSFPEFCLQAVIKKLPKTKKNNNFSLGFTN